MKKGQIAIKIYAAFRASGKTWDIDEGVPENFSPFEKEMAWLAQEVANSALSDLAENPSAINAGAWQAAELAKWELGTKSTVMLDDAVIHAVGLMHMVHRGKFGLVTEELMTEVRLAATALTNVTHALSVVGRDFVEELNTKGIVGTEYVYDRIARMLQRRRSGRTPSMKSLEFQILKEFDLAKP